MAAQPPNATTDATELEATIRALRGLQRVTLLHRSAAAPTVFVLNGCYLSLPAQSELTYLLESNQLEVEHRFFPPSSRCRSHGVT